MAKAQMEIMGLAVIVILAAIGLFYMIAFSTGNTELPAQTFRASEQAQNAVIAMLNTDVPGCGTTLENVIADYATYQNLQCLRSETMISPEKIEVAANIMLESTLEAWGRTYEMNITIPGRDTISVSSETRCTGAYETGAQPIPLYPAPGTATMMLIVCV